jgi:integrase
MQLDESLVQSLKCEGGVSHWEAVDTYLPGLFVDVQSSGRLTYRLRYDQDGRRKNMTLGNARVLKLEEAREKARTILRKVMKDEGEPLPDLATEEMTVAAFFLTQYLPYVKSYKRSWKTDESMIRMHIIPRLGMRPMAALKPGEIAATINAMLEKEYSPGTCNRLLTLIRYAFKLAKRWLGDSLTRNPAADLVNLRHDSRIERYLSKEQSEVLFASLMQSPNELLIYIVQFLIYTGARKREALDAQWVDVDLERRLWRIPKTKSGKVRHVPLSNEVTQMLTELRTKLPAGARYVFPNPDTGKPFVSIFYSWDAARRRADLPELRIHDLRHSFASFLVNAGRSLYEVQQLLGHADIRTTSRYAHLHPDRLRNAVESVPLKAVGGVEESSEK